MSVVTGEGAFRSGCIRHSLFWGSPTLCAELGGGRTHCGECFVRYVFVFDVSVQSKKGPE
jgi:hypothetical protein